jgi:hypothetical protein
VEGNGEGRIGDDSKLRLGCGVLAVSKNGRRPLESCELTFAVLHCEHVPIFQGSTEVVLEHIYSIMLTNCSYMDSCYLV